MKILILGASGNVGSVITNILKKKNINHKTLGSKQNDINIDIKKDINSFIQIFRNHKYTHIINCLWIRNEQNLIGNYEHIHKLIISIKNELKSNNITWIEISSIAVNRYEKMGSLKFNKRTYEYQKYLDEYKIKKLLTSNNIKIKILRLASIITNSNNHYLKKLNNTTFFNYLFLPGRRQLNINITDQVQLENKLNYILNTNFDVVNLYKSYSLDSFLKKYDVSKKLKIIELQINVLFFKIFLKMINRFKKFSNFIINFISFYYKND